ncbi:hypothetical protein [Haloarcula sp. 1CSR25-25]|uniref:hypothetical protein n=1 Tax=Haloarcula sp. 1CSR25-25 TaxID=2862545 RepID=UPI00289449CC|nr:hypothetical protein [Haloarcula sp. 1CSR25-25]MDT3433249.1 hypothetical protein [Haloarcula sp. 1CSR25-25]
MATNLFRVTVDEPNYSRVLETPVDEENLESAELLHLNGTRLWAQRNSDSGQQVYEALSPGDGLLFYKVQRGYTSDEGQYVATGRVGEKQRLKEKAAHSLFGTQVATLGYTVTDFTPISKSIADIDDILGYSSYPQSSHRVTNDRYRTVEHALEALIQ